MKSLSGSSGRRRPAAAYSWPPVDDMPSSSQTDQEPSYGRQLDDQLSPQDFSLGPIIDTPANRQLASVILCRSPDAESEIQRLCREKGADAEMAISLATDHPLRLRKGPISLLSVAIDAADSSIPVLFADRKELHDDRRLDLPLAISRGAAGGARGADRGWG
ncbi:unnamed protein product [Vitrella brassicaformis CCMP3155]|uniref:Uncharacterized protein n=1 Tax=Vitrella brassicaformis (strain CCMP3155) TaxID=1169540 RepID=A0A0G4ER59_VITBC|nr:unnamed protein product [Vitrella brassicaformis CCMP3155]|mmetsp:Transcript_14319/g.34143  ORF Transcript_14319/g.34143 Transcript_14319/m.34143 type:complete len:162 (-) Transcript_14319:789-1274(-)|eukprot:CEL99937.1 unnamed protein product [Vitrella brassicaformis CCMP3155]